MAMVRTTASTLSQRRHGLATRTRGSTRRASRPGLPMGPPGRAAAQLPQARPPCVVARLTEGPRPETYRGSEYLLFHVNFGAPEEYGDSHLPGAIHLDTNQLEDPDANWNRRPVDELRANLLALGISADTTVILY